MRKEDFAKTLCLVLFPGPSEPAGEKTFCGRKTLFGTVIGLLSVSLWHREN